MKKIIFLALFFVISSSIFAQATEKVFLNKNEEAVAKLLEAKPNGWVKKGTLTFLANQATFNNWLAGGQSNFSGNMGINYDFNYKKDNWNWDNKLIASYGLTKINGQEMQKSDDRFLYNSLLGKKTSEYWFFSAFLNITTQFDSGFEKGVKTSHFFSPAYFQFGPGLLWKKSDNLKLNFAPITSKLIVVNSQFTQTSSSFGVEQSKTSRYELGAAINGYYKFNLATNINVENIMNLYTNYLDKPQNVDVDYTVNVTMKINKLVSTNFILQTLFDDNTNAPGLDYAKVQTRQIIGFGLNYGF